MALYRLNLNKRSLTEDHPSGAEVQGKMLAIVLHKGKVYAMNGICMHAGGPLDKGRVEGDKLVCPWHGGAFFIETGKADPKTPWVHDIKTYRMVEDAKTGELSVEL